MVSVRTSSFPTRALALTLALTLVASSFVATAAHAAPTPVSVTGDPIAPLPAQAGTGLCSASSVSASPATDFPQTAATFNAGMNAFIEAQSARTTTVLGTAFDLSNNAMAGSNPSYGDFTNAVATCATGGCGFFVNDTTTSFGARYRGFLAVSAAMAGHALHVGFYADDAVSLTVFDKAATAYPVVTRSPALGTPTWRTTNTVTFAKSGLYAVEILYAQIVEGAALEFSMLQGTFTDFETPASQAPVTSLSTAGFTLAAPAVLYQTESGEPSSSNLTMCAQCMRAQAGAAGNGGCATGTRCNAAALCAPCDDAQHCGATCVACGAQQACVSGQCVAAPDAGASDAGSDAASSDASAMTDASAADGGHDDASVADASSAGDASTGDAGAGGDAGSDSGCGCRTSRRAPTGFAFGAVLALFAAIVRRRRGRSRVAASVLRS